MKLYVLSEGAKEEAAIDLIRRTIAGTPYEGRVYIAGGFVRDEIMGKQSNDIDLVIDEDNGGIKFAEWLTKTLGIHKEGSNPVIYPRFGTAMFSLRRLSHLGQDLSGIDIECVMPRAEENEIPDDRQSIVVRKTTMNGDAFRRDLTINALYKNISTGQILDLTGHGIEDIKNGVLRTPTNPDDTFGHPKFGDPLRMLRVIRFASKYGFEVNQNVIDSIKKNANRLKNISQERIKDELEKMLLSSKPAYAIRMLRDTGLLSYIIPEFSPMVGLEQGIYHDKDAFEHTMDVIESTPPSLITRLAALLHDIGKPGTRQPHQVKGYEFIGHEDVSAEMASDILKRLRFPGDVIAKVVIIIQKHMSLRPASEELSDKALRKFARGVESDENLTNALDLMQADYEAHPSADKSMFKTFKARFAKLKDASVQSPLKQKVISGEEIMKELGVPQGPMVGKALKYVQELYDSDPSIDKRTIIDKLRELIFKN
jgi:putative nucleotidyltransferase with HDIG domain